jgi:capsular polysaccharide transport system ATP-binding protein
MIIAKNVSKHYITGGTEKWVLQNVSFTIPPKISVGLMGGSGAGKSTLLRLIGGIEPVTHGKIERHCRVSWPMGYSAGLQKSMTGRQNAKFIFQIHGVVDNIEDKLAAIREFAELGESFDKPIKSYTPAMRSAFLFGLFIASDFDVYVSDIGIAVGGNPAFKEKVATTLEALASNAAILMATSEINVLKRFCTAGIWLNEGQAVWFDDINDAIKQHKRHTRKNTEA